MALVVAAIASPLLITALLVALLSDRDGPERMSGGPDSVPAGKLFNTAGLPPISTDTCPAAADLLPQPSTGRDALPDLTLDCIGEIGSADTVSLRRLGGVPTVVNLWATWCTACRQEMPDLQAVHAAAGTRLRVIGVNTKDYAEGARATINNTGIRFASLADPGQLLLEAVGSQGMPVTLFVAADGKVVHRKLGQYADRAAIEDDIAEYLGVRL